MTAIEVTLLVIGAIITIVSFVFASKSDEKAEANVELSNKQKEDMRNQIISIFDEQMDSIVDKTEVELDKMANRKMSEMNEYSETILGEINKNHNEVMFLYDMLNEKQKEVKNTVRDLNLANKERAKEAGITKPAPEIQIDDAEDVGFMSSEAAMKKEQKAAQTTRKPRAKKTAVTDQVAAAEDNSSEQKPAPKTKKKTTSAKTAASRAKMAVQKDGGRNTESNPELISGGNNNEKILELNKQGKSNIEIAKELGLGIGEVKLVVDLFRGGR